MSYSMDYPLPVDQAPASERAGFIRRTYGHLAGGVLVFMILETILLQMPFVASMVRAIEQTPMLWLLVLGLFFVVNMVADSWARSDRPQGMQYLGFGLCIFGWALVFTFPLWYAAHIPQYHGVITQAAIMTGCVFGGLTLTVLFTGKDYSFLAPVLSIGTLLAGGFILAAIIFGFHLGLIFCFAMVALASVSIIYNTSNVMHRYSPRQHVAAAMALFASVALLFWSILQIAMANRE
jgi:FtsH-binding integral membrane protein